MSTHRVAGRAFLAIPILALLAGSVQAQTTLKYKFKEGDKLNYAMEMTQKQTMNVQGMEVETVTTQSMDMSWVIKSLKGDKAQVTQTIERIRVKVDSPFAGFEYDSKDGKEPEGPIGMLVGPLFAAMAGAEFTVTMNEQGEISETKVSEKLMEAMKANPMMAQMGFSEDAIKNMLGQTGGSTLSKTAVKKGDTWNQKTELKMPPLGLMKVSNTYTYAGPETRDGVKVEKIDLKADMSIEPLPNAGQEIEIKIKSSESKGALYFDNTAGRLVETSMNSKTAMEITAMGNVIEMLQDQTISMKLVK